MSELLDQVFTRMEQDYVVDGPDGEKISLVKVMMTNLYCSRRGLTEDEIMQLYRCSREVKRRRSCFVVVLACRAFSTLVYYILVGIG